MSKFHPLAVSDVRRETEDTVSVAFEVPAILKDTYQFIHGQYLTLRKEINGEDVRRSYSICRSPLDGELRVAIKHVPDGRFSTYANEALQTGEILEVMPPAGNFHTPLAPDQARHYAFFAAGSGITPVMSIIRTILVAEPKSRITLVYGNRSFKTIIFREELEGLKNQYMDRLNLIHVLSRENPGVPLYKGRIDGEKCQQLCQTLIDPADLDECFICGPEPMIQAVSESLKGMGVPPEHIHFELFTSPVGKLGGSAKQEKARELDPQDCEVSVTIDGDTLEFVLNSQGDSVLDAATALGADLPFACKGGVCCTCRAKLVEGEVVMDNNYALRPDEVEQNFILTCQSHPVSKKVRIDFDVK